MIEVVDGAVLERPELVRAGPPRERGLVERHEPLVVGGRHHVAERLALERLGGEVGLRDARAVDADARRSRSWSDTNGVRKVADQRPVARLRGAHEGVGSEAPIAGKPCTPTSSWMSACAKEKSP